ncbi:MAG TPA: peptidyl-prolyl cis-trans isomerase [Polyangiaceae bacterium]|nr:peptidyl-prolyl cis-trans isomerase [Polyangiaceae bacterium]
MRSRAIFFACCLASAAAAAANADATAPVVRVGELSATGADITRRLSTLSAGQFAAYGGGAEVPRRYVDEVVVPELAATLEARQRGVDKSPAYRDRERVALRQALEAALKADAIAKKPVTQEDIKAYFEANKARFEQPLAIRLWRILVDDEASAKRIIEQVKDAGSPAKWSELARDSSVDKATNLRQGDLGFVHADGGTDVPQVRVNPALFQAAKDLKDGAVVPTPVHEGAKFAVVWRRGSRPERTRTLEQERDSIRSLLERQRAEDARSSLLTELRQKYLREEHPELLDEIPEGMFGSKLARPRPMLVPPHARSIGTKLPEPTPQGLR